MTSELKKFLIVGGILLIAVSYCTGDAMRKIDCSTIGLAMWILFLMLKRETK